MASHFQGERQMRRGRLLRPGDVVGIVAPAGPVSLEPLQKGVALLQAWGFQTRLGSAVLTRRGYLAGSDEERTSDLNAMWADPDVAGIICARGGYGAMRILDRLDWQMIRAHPKFFCGFSDITALHLGLQLRAGLVTFHGPMVAALGKAADYNEAGLRNAMQCALPLGEIDWPAPAPDAPTPVTVRPGWAQGRLIGGNLTLLCSLMGTPYEPDLCGRIILVEEVGEAPYRVDRMLTQLLLAGKLQQAAGIVFGDSPSCMHAPGSEPSLLDVLQRLLTPLAIPVLYGFPCGHGAYRATLPLGVEATLDANTGTLTLLEAALVDEPV